MRHLYIWNYRLFLSQKITSGKMKGQTQEWSLNINLSAQNCCFFPPVKMKDTETNNYIA